jgi:isocitrate dehydrogenase (NAD+)
VFLNAGVPVDFDVHYLSEVSYGQSESVEDVCRAVRESGVAIQNHLSVPEYSPTGQTQSLSRKFKVALDLFGNVALIRSRPGIKARHQNVDMVIIRESIEGECEWTVRKIDQQEVSAR